jgi:hypothetical protein
MIDPMTKQAGRLVWMLEPLIIVSVANVYVNNLALLEDVPVRIGLDAVSQPRVAFLIQAVYAFIVHAHLVEQRDLPYMA